MNSPYRNIIFALQLIRIHQYHFLAMTSEIDRGYESDDSCEGYDEIVYDVVEEALRDDDTVSDCAYTSYVSIPSAHVPITLQDRKSSFTYLPVITFKNVKTWNTVRQVSREKFIPLAEELFEWLFSSNFSGIENIHEFVEHQCIPNLVKILEKFNPVYNNYLAMYIVATYVILNDIFTDDYISRNSLRDAIKIINYTDNVSFTITDLYNTIFNVMREITFDELELKISH